LRRSLSDWLRIQQAKTALETDLVLLDVVRIDLTPIAVSVPIKKFLRVLARLFES
jgi:hypothetical protein